MNPFDSFVQLKKLQSLFENATELFSPIVNIETLSKSIESTNNEITNHPENISSNQLCEICKIDQIKINIDIINEINDRIKNNKIDIQSLIDNGYIQRIIKFYKTSNQPIPYAFGLINMFIQNKSITISDDIINVLIGNVSNPQTNHHLLHRIIESIAAIIYRYPEKYRDLFTDKYDILNKIKSLCNPDSSIEIMMAVSRLICAITKHNGLKIKHHKLIINKVSLLMMYDVEDILFSTCYSFYKMFKQARTRNTKLEHEFGGENRLTLKNDIKSKLMNGSLLVNGYVVAKPLNPHGISMPVVIIKLITCYYSPFGLKSNINKMEFNIIKRCVNLLRHPYDTNRYSLMLCNSMIKYHNKYTKINVIKQMIENGIVNYLEMISSETFSINLIDPCAAGSFFVMAVIRFGTNEEMQKLIDTNIFFKFLSKWLKNKQINRKTQQKIIVRFRKILKQKIIVRPHLLGFVTKTIQNLQNEQSIMEENKEFLNGLIHRIT